MRYARVPGIPFPVSRCVLGTSGFRDERAHRLLDAFVESGGNCIDTARAYGGGVSEHVVGSWIRRRKPERLVILGKGVHPPSCLPSTVAVDLAQSLDTLGVERIDLYMLHRDNADVAVGEFIDALDEQAAAGRIAAYGASNWSHRRLVEANRFAAARGSPGVVAASNHFSLAEPLEPLHPGSEPTSPDLARYLEDSGISLFPWSSQARGFFADVPPESLDPRVWRCWGNAENYARRERARTLAASLGVRAINVALAFVLSQPFVTFPIVGPQDEEELRITLDGVDLPLDAQQLRWLRFGGPPDGLGTGQPPVKFVSASVREKTA